MGEEEWKEFQDLMRHGKADNNIMNVNTGGKKKGKDGREMEDWEEEFDQGYGKDKYDMEMMKPYLPVIKAMIEEMTGMDCEELIAMIEEKVFDGHKIAEVMWAIKNGHITKEDMQMWAMEKW